MVNVLFKQCDLCKRRYDSTQAEYRNFAKLSLPTGEETELCPSCIPDFKGK